ncbi:MAG: hypothetical protein Q8L69_14300, partial [Gallionellaceae bacterium]|nr:hypothetical protein [Gallionellaceae bacterium]
DQPHQAAPEPVVHPVDQAGKFQHGIHARTSGIGLRACLAGILTCAFNIRCFKCLSLLAAPSWPACPVRLRSRITCRDLIGPMVRPEF